MNSVKKTGEAILFGCFVFLFFVILFGHRMYLPGFMQVAGRMHPMILHFPIVLLLLSFFCLCIPSMAKNNRTITSLLLVATLSAFITAITGLLLSLENRTDTPLLQWHKWFGIAIAFLSYALYTFRRFLFRNIVAARMSAIVSASLVIIAGHFGSVLTHGENFLIEPMLSDKPAIVDINKAVIFKDVIRPIFQGKCINCHNSKNAKGGLSLTDTSGLQAGGKTGSLFVSGDALSSLLIKRILLPDWDKKHMPPLSKSPLSQSEIKVLQAWVNAGSPLHDKLIALPQNDSFRIAATTFLYPTGTEVEMPTYDFANVDISQVKKFNNNFRVLEQLGENSPALSVSFFGSNMYTSESLKELLALKEHVVELNLARMPVKDNDLDIVKQMINLQKINLNYTSISSEGLLKLKDLNKLKELAIAGTAVNNTGLQALLVLPALRDVFVWNTAIDKTKLIGQLKNIHIEDGFRAENILMQLSPPQIKGTTVFFDSLQQIVLKHTLKDTEIRYSLDGNEPDSAKGLLYTSPLRITGNVTLMAKAYKEGWYGSGTIRKTYIRKGTRPDLILLNPQPNTNYLGATGELLFDEEIGDTNPDGKWFGYARPFEVMLIFRRSVEVSQVLLNIMKLTESGRPIFPPADIEVWAGADSLNLKLLKKVRPEESKKEEAALVQQVVSFSPTQAACIRIVLNPLKSIPSWHKSKGNGAFIFLNEIVIN